MLRRLLHPSSDLAFARDESQRFFPAVIALLVAVTCVFLAVGATVGAHLHHRSNLSQTSISIHIPYEISDETLRKKVEAVLAKAAPNFTRLNEADLKKRLKPWMGSVSDDENWPLPAVYQASSQSGGNAASLRAAMLAIHPDIRVDAGADWAQAYTRAITVTQALLVLLAGLMFAGLTLVTIYVARTSMRLHQQGVAVLHGMGAEDAYIIRQFERHALALALKGALRGLALALGVLGLAAAGLMLGEVRFRPPISWLAIALMLAVPLLACLVATLTTRASVKVALRALP